MNLNNYYLDLKKLHDLPASEQEIIHNYYKEMLYSFHDNRIEMTKSYFNTLLKSGYLIDIRDEKLTELLDGN